MNYTIVIPAIIAFCISALLGPVVIPFLRKLKVGQTVRDEGPKDVYKRQGKCFFCGEPVKKGYKVCEKHWKSNCENAKKADRSYLQRDVYKRQAG